MDLDVKEGKTVPEKGEGWLESKRNRALLLLLLLPPMLGELLSGSAPPLEFFNPVTFLLLVALYGCGAVLVRETAIKWGKGWASILLMGAAYGIVEEGLAVKSWFDPNWMDLGMLAHYGRFMGVNMVWAVWLTIFHAIISITVPIMIMAILYPSLRGERITTDRQFKYLVAVEFAVCLFIFLALTSYFPPVGHLLVALIMVAALVYAARELPVPLFGVGNEGPTRGPAWFWIMGTFLMFFNFIGYAGGGNFVPWAPVLVLVNMVVGGMVLVLILRHMGARDNDRHLLALTAGLLTWLLFLSIIHEFFTPGATGMLGVGIATVVLLVLLYHRVSTREHLIPEEGPRPASAGHIRSPPPILAMGIGEGLSDEGRSPPVPVVDS